MGYFTKDNRWGNPMKRYKREITKVEILNLVKTPSPTILEIGCNDGTDTFEFLETFPKGSIYCFEPDPRAIKRFRKNIHSSNCFLYEGCISDKNGTITFNMSSGRAPRPGSKENDKSGSIKTPKNNIKRHSWIKFEKQIEVQTITLDTWYERNLSKPVDFIWADVQGAEEELIRGGLRTLTESVRFFYTEYSDKELYEGQIRLSDIKALLPNFKPLAIYANNVLLKNGAIHE